jgi:hypothetical protein
MKETRLAKNRFPEECPYALEDILAVRLIEGEDDDDK